MGNAELGYGDGDETTVVSFGPSSSAKYITTYFRKTVNIPNGASFASYSLELRRDDGAVVYVNGAEVFRTNMPTGTITYLTGASGATSDDGNSIFTASLPASFFASGNNVIAVEIHQNNGSSSDISFDLQLKANAPGMPIITRGPYLQMGNGNSVSIRWRTDVATTTGAWYGSTPGSIANAFTDNTSTTEHEIRLTGMNPDTKYYYSIGTATQQVEGDANNFFTTAPASNTTRKLRIAAFGDCGRNDNNFQSGSLSAYRNYVGESPAEIMLLLGDNAYSNGTDTEYQSNFFNVYSGNILKNHVLFPAPGNHDYAQSSARQADKNIPYYSMFTVPANAECGGVASGTEAFYSYNWGNIHFLSLDSYGTETANAYRLWDTLGPQVTWIKQDLEANSAKWTVAYWHHPPYTMGSHNSDTESDLVRMRQNFIRILERYGVDLILCGHSHDYERSYLLSGYYGNEASFDVNTHAVTSSSGKYDGSVNSCPLLTTEAKVQHGTVYVVAGSSGANGGVQAGYPHNALPFSVDDGGMFYFEVEDNRLDAKFIRRDGVIDDRFTIIKDAVKTNDIVINSGEWTTLTASWPGQYLWSNGATTRSITVSPSDNTTYSVADNGSANCLTDVFNVTVNGSSGNTNRGKGKTKSADIVTGKIYPVPVRRGEMLSITINSNEEVPVVIYSEGGQAIMQLRINGSARIGTAGMAAGTYFVRDRRNGKQIGSKIAIID